MKHRLDFILLCGWCWLAGGFAILNALLPDSVWTFVACLIVFVPLVVNLTIALVRVLVSCFKVMRELDERDGNQGRNSR